MLQAELTLAVLHWKSGENRSSAACKTQQGRLNNAICTVTIPSVEDQQV